MLSCPLKWDSDSVWIRIFGQIRIRDSKTPKKRIFDKLNWWTGCTAMTFSIKAQTTVKEEKAGMPLIQSAAASFHLKKESTGYFEIISLHFLSFSTIFDEGHTCLQPLHINHKEGGRRLSILKGPDK